jgi:hypothetical protein
MREGIGVLALKLLLNGKYTWFKHGAAANTANDSGSISGYLITSTNLPLDIFGAMSDNSDGDTYPGHLHLEPEQVA